MALSEFEKERIERLFAAYAEKKIPLQFRDEIRIEHRFRGNEVILYESRPHYQDRSKWFSSPVARFKKDPASNLWDLYCADRNSKWHLYQPRMQNKDIEKLLAEVDKDPTGIFWG